LEEEVLVPLAQDRWARLRQLTLENSPQGPLLAAELRLIQQIRAQVSELAGLRSEVIDRILMEVPGNA
jgi:hypothetical protein